MCLIEGRDRCGLQANLPSPRSFLPHLSRPHSFSDGELQHVSHADWKSLLQRQLHRQPRAHGGPDAPPNDVARAACLHNRRADRKQWRRTRADRFSTSAVPELHLLLFTYRPHASTGGDRRPSWPDGCSDGSYGMGRWGGLLW